MIQALISTHIPTILLSQPIHAWINDSLLIHGKPERMQQNTLCSFRLWKQTFLIPWDISPFLVGETDGSSPFVVCQQEDQLEEESVRTYFLLNHIIGLGESTRDGASMLCRYLNLGSTRYLLETIHCPEDMKCNQRFVSCTKFQGPKNERVQIKLFWVVYKSN